MYHRKISFAVNIQYVTPPQFYLFFFKYFDILL